MAGQAELLIQENFAAIMQANVEALNKLSAALISTEDSADGFSEKIKNAVEFASNFSTVLEALKKDSNISISGDVDSSGIMDKLSTTFNKIKSNIGEKLIKIGQDAAGDVEGGLFDKVGDAVENGFSKIGEVGQAAFEKLGSFVGSIPEKFGDMGATITSAKENISEFIKKFDFSEIAGKVKDFASNAVSNIKDFITNGIDNLKDKFQSLKDRFESFDISGFGEKVKNGVSNAFTTAGDKISAFGSTFNDTMSGLGDKLDDSIGDLGKKIGPSIENAGISISGKMGDSFDDVAKKSAVMSGKVAATNGIMTAEIANANTAMAAKVSASTSTATAEIVTTSEAAMASTATTSTTAAARIGMAFKALAMVGIFLVVAAVAALFVAFKDLMSTNDEFSEKVLESWGKVKEACQPIIEAFQNLVATVFGGGEEGATFEEGMLNIVTSITDGIAQAVEFIAGIVTPLFEFLGALWQEHGTEIQGKLAEIGEMFAQAWAAIQEVFSGVIEILKALWSKYGEDIMATISAVWEFIKSIFSGAIDVITGIFDIIVGIFTGNGDKIKEGFSKLWEGIKEIFAGVGEFFGNIWNIIKEKFVAIGSKIGDAVSGAFKKVVNSIIGFAEGIINKFISGINKAIGLINKIPGVNIPFLVELNIPRLAKGALVSPGQMFVAREAGPELVGAFGSKSAVMNNNQIVESVSEGVYKAVLAAMGSNKTDQPLNITLQVGETQFGKVAVNAINLLAKVQGKVKLAI